VRVPQATNLFARQNPVVSLVNATTGAAIPETPVGLAGLVPVPPLTAMIRVLAQITSLATAGGAFMTLRDLPGGSDVAGAASPVLNVPGFWAGFLDLNNGRVTYTAQPGASTSYQVRIWITGFLRYA
jgi:hypothetical protein